MGFPYNVWKHYVVQKWGRKCFACHVCLLWRVLQKLVFSSYYLYSPVGLFGLSRIYYTFPVSTVLVACKSAVMVCWVNTMATASVLSILCYCSVLFCAAAGQPRLTSSWAKTCAPAVTQNIRGVQNSFWSSVSVWFWNNRSFCFEITVGSFSLKTAVLVRNWHHLSWSSN